MKPPKAGMKIWVYEPIIGCPEKTTAISAAIGATTTTECPRYAKVIKKTREITTPTSASNTGTP